MSNHVFEELNELMHYGTKRHSGRFPWGSGENPYQHTKDFLARIDELKAKGYTETQIAEDFGLKTTQYRVQKALANAERRADLVATAESLRAKGYSLQAIAEKMGYDNDSSVRSLLNANSKARMKQAEVTAQYLKDIVDKKGMVQVGSGVETELGISREKLKEALYVLELQGYNTYTGGVPQATNPGQQTIIKVLCPPGYEHKEIYKYDEVHTIKDYDQRLTEDGTKIRSKYEPPTSLNSDRLAIRYAEDEGVKKDGTIEIRRGLDDINLGNAHYAQIRMMVDGTHYLKGMAVYSDDLPEGVDVLFNTNKGREKGKMGVLKECKKDADGNVDAMNPFGALLRQEGGQMYYDDPNGKYTDPVTGKKQSLSPLNKTREEGDWDAWDDTLASQFLAKQPMYIVNKQLNLTKADKRAELDEILSLDNPVIKKDMLLSFAEDCDAASVHLKAAALPRQRWQVIMPLTTIKDNEIYAPNFEDGEEVALVRYPHGGTFEIPILTVNNKNKEGRKVFGTNPKDVIGINKEVADRLSGADFDGDTALVIPTNNGLTPIKSTKPLAGLKDFDPKMAYGTEERINSKGETEYYRNGQKIKPMRNTQNEMGRVSNLITDMTIMGAPEDELARAVRHSMVVIDAEKHHLDYKSSEKENGIAALRSKYQEGGASTLLSRAKGQYTVDKRQGSPKILEDGSLEWKTATDLEYPEKRKVRLKDDKGHYLKDDKGQYVYATNEKGRPIWEETGKIAKKSQRSTNMAETQDARTLVSKMDTKVENAYADYANYMKELAKTARREAVYNTPKFEYNKEAKEKYKSEVESLDNKLTLAKLNRPKEKQAQLIAASEVNAIKLDNPHISKAELRKAGQKALSRARARVGAERQAIPISDKEWEAIQAGAISATKLREIVANSDKDRLRQLATPRQTTGLSDAQIGKIKAMSSSGYTNEEIAKRIGRSVSTVIKYL